MHNQIEIKVESPISIANANSNAQHLIVHQRKGKVNTRLGPDLYRASLRGDWKAAKTALSQDKNIACIEITERGDRALHIAAAAKQTAFVHNLVEHLNTSDLELQNRHGHTAFYFAVVSGVVEIAKVMYEKNKNLTTIRGSIGKTPLEMAILLRNRKMVEYLYPITPLEDLNAEECIEILVATIHTDMFDIALKILNAAGAKIVTSPTTDKGRALKILARKPLSHNHRIQERIWETLVSIIFTVPYIPYFKRIYSSLQMRRQASRLVKGLREQIMTLPDSDIIKLIQETQVFHDAAKIGNVEFLTLFAHLYPDLIWKVDLNKYSIFHVAVINRQEKVFNLIHQIGAFKDLITLYKDKEGNNILHLAGKLAPPSRLNIVSGAALQMQRELQWFKEVEKIVSHSLFDMKNNDDKTPRELFSEEHKNLSKDGEEWMKKTATSCMVVPTLIATVAFAATFTVPGGNNETGTPVFLKNRWFTIFVISDAVAMFSSTTSIMMFLSILTSRYTEDDFLFSLPAKLMVGLVSLFASIVCMVLTFSATFFLVYNEEKHEQLPRLVAALAWLPITIYAVLNYRLWIALIHSTCWPAMVMFQPGKHRLY
ncbi:unnamed protein product [Fraxinus pennsylvanica]|uniref:PGG domain-containing protein n=1 Tax=Fraxinus pennsylvanica TaxID=56036 RepID=A0AAD1ZPU3_9LAMI|nr:unnamed protein product [Fraxinus pennsylvanica]